MAYGLTDTGFQAPDQYDIHEEMKADLRASVSPNLDLESTGVIGVLSAIVASREAKVWDTLGDVYASGDPYQATGQPLDAVCAITGTRRGAPTKSAVTVNLTLTAGTAVPAGSVVRVLGSPSVRFVSRDLVSATTSGVYPVTFLSETTGPIRANAGTLTDIVTRIDGWTAATNPLDATPGTNGDTDTQLRAQREAELATTGSGTADAIRAHLMAYEAADGTQPIVQCGVFENNTDTSDANGLPPHSVEILVYDPVTLPNDEIAQVIWDKGAAAGVNTSGALSGTATDSEGVQHTLKFSRATRVEVQVEVTVRTGDNWPDSGASLVRDAVLGVSFAQGTTVYRSDFYPSVLDVVGVRSITRVRLTRAGGSLGDADVSIGIREIAYTQSAGVTVVVT